MSDATVVDYAYDPFGRRISKTVNGVTARYLYDGEDILMEYDGSGNITARYTHGPDIDEPIAMARDGQTYYYQTDGLGSIIGLTNSNQQIIQTYTYDSFGNIVSQVGNITNPYTYTGREYDIETDLYYYRARYYDPQVGRFISKDPFPGYLDNPQTLNLYQYVGNNPVNFVDPFGLHTYVPIGQTPDGGTIYGVFDDNGNFIGYVTGAPPSGGLCLECERQALGQCIAQTYDPEQIEACKSVCNCPLWQCKALCATCVAGKTYEIGSCFWQYCRFR